jgi:hypothetical protein
MAVVDTTIEERSTSVAELRAQLETALTGLDPQRLTTDDAASLVEELARIEKLAAGGRTVLARRAAQSDRWKRAGEKSPEDWLARHAGRTKVEAKRTLTASRRLQELDDTKTALLAGKLSARQAEAVAAGADADPGAEGELLAAAELEPLAALNDRVAKVKAAAEANPDRHQAKLHAEREVRFWTDAEGAGCAFMRGPQSQMARLRASIDRELDTVFAANRRAGRRERLEAYTFDALHRLLGTEDAPDGDRDDEASRGKRKRDELIVHATLPALVTGRMGPGDSVEVPGVGPYPLADARRLLCGDAIVRLVVSSGTDVRTVVTDSRAVTVAMRAALAIRDGGRCVVPGCGRPGVEIHHTVSATGYADSGQTTIDELAWVCKHHHDDLTFRRAELGGSHQEGWRFTPPPPEHAKPPGGAMAATTKRRRRST